MGAGHSSASVLRLIQVSDCHISEDPKALYRGLSADRCLAGLLPGMRRWQPEYILLTGDVTEDGSRAACGRAGALLGTVGAPVLALPGNHDNAETMRRFFPAGPWRGPFSFETRGWQLVLLDSSVPGEVPGRLSGDALERLAAVLKKSGAAHMLVALHHQPVPVGAAWIDRYPLEEPEALFEVLDAEPRLRAVVWGHVHQDFRAERNGVLLLGSPSSVANSLPGTRRFTPDHAGPACRWLELGPGGEVETGLIRSGRTPG